MLMNEITELQTGSTSCQNGESTNEKYTNHNYTWRFQESFLQDYRTSRQKISKDIVDFSTLNHLFLILTLMTPHPTRIYILPQDKWNMCQHSLYSEP